MIVESTRRIMGVEHCFTTAKNIKWVVALRQHIGVPLADSE